MRVGNEVVEGWCGARSRPTTPHDCSAAVLLLPLPLSLLLLLCHGKGRGRWWKRWKEAGEGNALAGNRHGGVTDGYYEKVRNTSTAEMCVVRGGPLFIPRVSL